MALWRPKGAGASLHRLLLRRLLGMTLCICLLLAGAVYLRESTRYDEAVLHSTLQGAEGFRSRILAQLDAPGPLQPEHIQAVLDGMAVKRPVDPLGRIIAVRVVDERGNTVGQLAPASVTLAAEAARFLVEHPFAFAPGEPGLFRKVVRLGDRPHLHLGIALANSAGREVLFVEAMYAVSEEVLAGITQGMLGSVGLVVLVVLATTLLLYPAIIQLLRRVTDLSAHLQEANLETLSVLGSAIAKRDSDTDLHNYRVTLYAVRLAETLGLSPRAIRSLIKGALLHDVGKIGIRDAILLKPGRLSTAEFAEMRGHVQHGRDIVAPAAWLRDGMEVISGHHERYDGAGYDAPLAGPDIPLGARLFAIVDVFDALTSRRPYKEPLSCDESLAIIAKERGSHFDPEVLDAFLRMARQLYAEIALCDEAALKERLRAVQRTYFTTEFDVMAESMGPGAPEA